jgi:hypothetical protein
MLFRAALQWAEPGQPNVAKRQARPVARLLPSRPAREKALGRLFQPIAAVGTEAGRRLELPDAQARRAIMPALSAAPLVRLASRLWLHLEYAPGAEEADIKFHEKVDLPQNN